MTSFFTFLTTLVALSFSLKLTKHEKFLHKRPESGVGPIQMSNDELVDDINEDRIVFIFDKDCKTSHEDVNKVILQAYDSCLTDTVHHYDFPTLGMALTYLDVNTEGCHLNSTVKLDWDGLCIDSIMYESLHKQNSYDIVDNVDCEMQDLTMAPNGTSWALNWLNGNRSYMYSYPDRSYDNGVDIFIIDDGIRSTHDEFYPGQVQVMYGEGFNKKFGAYEPHGTHVAGLAGGMNYGSSKNFTIYDMEVCLYFRCAESTIIGALNTILEYLTNNSGRRGVINMSLGFQRNYLAIIYTYYADAIQDVGGIIVVAAGNDNDDACYYTPAYASNMITVGAITDYGWKSYFSNWGDCVDAWAPGSDIISASADCDSCYVAWDGTSMASPLVAGVIANLLWIDPTLTFNEIKTALTIANTSQTVYCGGGSNWAQQCYAVQYWCDLYSEIFNVTGAPTETQTTSPDLDLSVDNSYGCNYLEYVIFNDTDRSQVVENTYIPTDVCIRTRQYSNVHFNKTDAFSYIYECSSDNNYTVTMKVYNKVDNCTGDADLEEEIMTGFDDDYHYYVINCANDVSSDDSSACNLNTYWESAFILNETFIPLYETIFNVDIDESQYYSERSNVYCLPRVPAELSTKAFMVGFCYKSIHYGYNYMFYCDSDGIYELYFDGDCTFDPADVTGYIFYDTCANYSRPYPEDSFDLYGNPSTEFYVDIATCPDLADIIGEPYSYTMAPTPAPNTPAPTMGERCEKIKQCDTYSLYFDDDTPINVTMDVDIGYGFNLSSIVVSVKGTHTWMGDIVMELYAPDGRYIYLLNDNGGSAEGFDIVFSDDGSRVSRNFTDGAVLRPVGGTFFKRLGNGEITGEWILSIIDEASGDDGELQEFCIQEVCYFAEGIAYKTKYSFAVISIVIINLIFVFNM